MNRKLLNTLLNYKAVVIIGLIWIFVLFSCSGTSTWNQEIEWEALGLDDIPGEEEYPDAGAIVLFDEGEMSLSAGGDVQFSRFSRHRIVKILNNRGHIYANIVIPYSPKNSIKNIRARTISPDGEVTVLEQEDIFDVNMFPDFIWYSDQRAKRFTMPAVEDGAIIEYSYELTVSTLTYMHSWTFQEGIPTLLSRFTLNNPSQLDVEYRMYGIDMEPEINEAPEGFNSSYTWEARNTPALNTEVGMPPQTETLSRLALAPIGVKTWDDVADWYNDLITPRMQANQNLKDLANDLVQDADTNYEKLEKLFGWVRDQVRYIAVSIGIGGYQPHDVDDIFRNQYGDCKDMVTLLVTMAREVGIEAYETLISTYQNGEPDTTLPSPYHFNHVIAYAPNVGDSGVWMDPTEKGTEFGQLPWYDQGMPVLKVNDDGTGQVIMTPKDSPQKNLKVMDWRVELSSDGSATIYGKRRLWGANASNFREDLMNTSPGRQRQWLETDLAQLCSGATLDTFSITGTHPVKNPLTIDYKFHTNTFAKVRENQMVIEPGDVSSLELPILFRGEKREHKIRFSYGYVKDVNLEIEFPEEWVVETESKLDSITSKFGKVEWNWWADGQTFHANVNYLMNGEDVLPGQYTEFRDFLDEVRRVDLQEIILTKRQRAELNDQESGAFARSGNSN